MQFKIPYYYLGLPFGLLLFLSTGLCLAQTSLQTSITKLANHPDMAQGALGVMVLEVQSGRVIASHNEDQTLMPASTQKLITTATGMAVLGSEYRFKTEICHDGSRTRDGILNGNIYIKGYGDPTLGSAKMSDVPSMERILNLMASDVQQSGIRSITGSVIGDASWIPSAPNARSWQWADIGNYYGVGAWGLNLHENYYFLHFQQKPRLGQTPEVASIQPEVPNLLFFNEVRSAGANTGDNAYIFGSPFSHSIYLRGTIPVGSSLFTIKGAIPNPPLFAAYHFRNQLKAYQIEVNGGFDYLQSEPGPTTKILKTYYSPPLSQICKRANYNSVNVYCESILRATGKQSTTRAGNKESCKAVQAFWAAKGVQTKGWFMEDGSGLSARNGITANQMASILRLAALDNRLGIGFMETLPKVGMEGSVKTMLRTSPAAGKIRAKSGSIRRVRCYAGYAYSRSGKLYAFALLANNFSGKSSFIKGKMAEIMQAIYYLDK